MEPTEDRSLRERLDAIADDVAASSRSALESIMEFLRQIDFSAPFEFFALGIAIVAFFLVLVILIARQLFGRRRRGDELYSAHPTMIQGNVGTLSFLLVMLVVPTGLVFFIWYLALTDRAPQLLSEYLYLVISILTIYFLIGAIGTFVWSGVSSSERLVIKRDTIRFDHELNTLAIAGYLFLLGILWVLLGACANFLHRKVPIPITKWYEQLIGATGGERRNHTATYPQGSVAKWQPRSGIPLKWFGIGHVKLILKTSDTQTEDHEFRYMPQFKTLEAALERFGGESSRRKK